MLIAFGNPYNAKPSISLLDTWMTNNTLGLANQYYVMRHGESQANARGIVVSDPERGIMNYGLTERGRNQARESATEFIRPDKQLRIYCSDFRRARETADIVRNVLSSPTAVVPCRQLRERYFGDLDGGSDTAYEEIWTRDALNPSHTELGVESVMSILTRTSALLESLERCHREQRLLLIAHGDVLQILQTAFAGLLPSQHRQLPPLQVAEIRPL